MGADKHINMVEPEDDGKIITGTIEGMRFYFTRLEAIDLINELSVVLLADERQRS